MITSIDNIINQTDSSRTAGTYHIANVDSNGSPIHGFTTSGVGIEAAFAITVNSNGTASIDITSGGSDDNCDQYCVDEIITIRDSELGGGGAENLVFNVASISEVTYG